MWQFKTARFVITARIVADEFVDTSFDETGETAEKISSGEWFAFNTTVTVALRNGAELGSDTLCGSIYETPREFFTAHRDADPMNRNCSIMRAKRGDLTICHYFPDMVRNAISEARNALHDMPKVRAA
jgi:hypothetical protein